LHLGARNQDDGSARRAVELRWGNEGGAARPVFRRIQPVSSHAASQCGARWYFAVVLCRVLTAVHMEAIQRPPAGEKRITTRFSFLYLITCQVKYAMFISWLEFFVL
jgi:hypothetical protein